MKTTKKKTWIWWSNRQSIARTKTTKKGVLLPVEIVKVGSAKFWKLIFSKAFEL